MLKCFSKFLLPLIGIVFLFNIQPGDVYAQAGLKIIAGTIVDIKGNPLSGVSVTVKGTNDGTTTDLDGHYSLSVPNETAILAFSYLGFNTVEERIGSKRISNVVLEEKIAELNELVVVGYGTQKKVSVVGAVANIEKKEIERMATPSLANTLGGRIAGVVTRQAHSEPGYDQAALYIRGFGTWVNRAPLILVDGIERDMNVINTEEVESISFLKDASATAVYGVRGANGVILIKTRQGTMGKPQVTFRTEHAVLTGLRYPNYINSAEYAGLVNEGRHNSGILVDAYLPGDIELYANGSDPYLHPNVDWVKEILRKNTSQSINNLNISGGNELVRYFVNVGYTHESGLYNEDGLNKFNTNADVKRYNYRSNVDVNLSPDLKVELGVGGIIQKRNFPGVSMPSIWWALRATPPLAFPKTNPDGSIGGQLGFLGSNPWATLTQTGYDAHNWNTLQGTFSARWDLSKLITKGLSLNGRFAYDHTYNNNFKRTRVFEVKQYLGVDENTGEDIYQTHRENGSWIYEAIHANANRAIYYETTLNYDNNFGLHSVSGMLLFNRRDYVNLNTNDPIASLPFRRQGLAGRFTYDFDNRYLAEFNFGYNGSEQFAPQHRYGFFPSLSLGWIPSGEAFWKENSILSYLKIRGSYGKVGNDNVGGGRFMYLTRMNTNGGGYSFYSDGLDQWMTGIIEGSIGYTNLTWETASKTNIGIDLHLLKDRVNLSVDVFDEYRDRILIQRQTIPQMVGYVGSAIPYGNLGIVKNKGIETMLDINHTSASGIFYSLKGNFTFATNKIIENDEPKQKWSYQSAKGKRIDQPFGLVALGFFENEEEIASCPKQMFQSVVRPGDIKYLDYNNDGVIDQYDAIAIGHPRTPEIMYGFGATIGYKGWELSLAFTGAARTSFFLEGETIWPFINGEGSFNVLKEYYDNRYIYGADNSRAKYPAVGNGDSQNNYRPSTLWMMDGSYLKLKNAEIAYTLPQKVSNLLHIANIRLFMNGQNLLTIDKIKIIDPESNNGTGVYPSQRILNFGAKINF